MGTAVQDAIYWLVDATGQIMAWPYFWQALVLTALAAMCVHFTAGLR